MHLPLPFGRCLMVSVTVARHIDVTPDPLAASDYEAAGEVVSHGHPYPSYEAMLK
jgi:hypothetical protein